MKKRTYLTMTLFLALLTISCSKEEATIIQQEGALNLNFDYKVYENKEILYQTLKKIELNNNGNRNNTVDDFEEALNIINTDYGTDLTTTQLDLYQINNPSIGLETLSQNGYIDSQEYIIINSFFIDLNDYNFNESIQRLEDRVIAMNLDYEEFDKYNFLVNTLLITNDYYLSQGIDIFSEIGLRVSGSCAVAIAANAVSTYGLTSCIVPGPNCWAAIIGKGLSLLGMFLSCSNQ